MKKNSSMHEIKKFKAQGIPQFPCDITRFSCQQCFSNQWRYRKLFDPHHLGHASVWFKSLSAALNFGVETKNLVACVPGSWARPQYGFQIPLAQQTRPSALVSIEPHFCEVDLGILSIASAQLLLLSLLPDLLRMLSSPFTEELL